MQLTSLATSARISRTIGVVVAVGLHVIALALLMDFVPQPVLVPQPKPIMVSLITEEVPPKPKADMPPKPLPVAPMARPKPLLLPPVLTAPVEAPTVATAPPQPPMPLPVAPVEVAASPAPAPALPAPPAVVPPSFNAAYLRNPPPLYPNLARRAGQQGRVVLRVLVNPAGTADQVVVRSSSGFTVLDNAAREVVYQWRFVPARKGDQAITEWVLVPINFSLEG